MQKSQRSFCKRESIQSFTTAFWKPHRHLQHRLKHLRAHTVRITWFHTSHIYTAGAQSYRLSHVYDQKHMINAIKINLKMRTVQYKNVAKFKAVNVYF